jgi:hypothetical protein
MARVYRYDFLDRALMRERRSDDYATAEAIERLGGTILPETARDIDDERVDDWGVVKAADIARSRAAPPAPSPESLRNPAQPTPDEPRPVDVVRDRIDLADSDQVRDWTRALGVTRNALEDAVRAVGPSLASVRRYLGNIQS